MAMNLRLGDDEAANLKRAAAKAGLSMQQAVRLAIQEWVTRADGVTMGELMSRPPLGGGRIPPGTAARVLHEARLEAGRE
jgi:Ribbon-helix-helix protein, copG family